MTGRTTPPSPGGFRQATGPLPPQQSTTKRTRPQSVDRLDSPTPPLGKRPKSSPPRQRSSPSPTADEAHELDATSIVKAFTGGDRNAVENLADIVAAGWIGPGHADGRQRDIPGGILEAYKPARAPFAGGYMGVVVGTPKEDSEKLAEDVSNYQSLRAAARGEEAKPSWGRRIEQLDGEFAAVLVDRTCRLDARVRADASQQLFGDPQMRPADRRTLVDACMAKAASEKSVVPWDVASEMMSRMEASQEKGMLASRLFDGAAGLAPRERVDRAMAALTSIVGMRQALDDAAADHPMTACVAHLSKFAEDCEELTLQLLPKTVEATHRTAFGRRMTDAVIRSSLADRPEGDGTRSGYETFSMAAKRILFAEMMRAGMEHADAGGGMTVGQLMFERSGATAAARMEVLGGLGALPEDPSAADPATTAEQTGHEAIDRP